MKMKINIDPPIHCCHADTLLSLDTIIHYVLLYFKCLRYHILFSISSVSQLEVVKIDRMFNNGDISQHQKKQILKFGSGLLRKSIQVRPG